MGRQAARGAPARVLRFFHVLLVIGLLEASLGLIQYFVEPGWILGYQNTASSVSGTLISKNHFAGLLGMLAFVPFGLAYASFRHRDPARTYLYLVGSAVIALSLVFSLSRMGVFSFVVSLLFVGTIMRLERGNRRMGTVLGMALMGIVLAGALWIGVDVIVERYGGLLDSELVLQDSRITIYRDTMTMIADRPWGVGAGNYQYVFRSYQSDHTEFLYDNAHNDYLQTAAEWGLVPALVFWALVASILVRGIRSFWRIESIRSRAILLTCIGGISDLLVHGLADFNLQIPVNAMLFSVFLGIAAAQSCDDGGRARRFYANPQ